MLEAALLGASSSIKLVANVLVNLISFLSLLAFMDSALSWVGDLFNYPQLNFEVWSSGLSCSLYTSIICLSEIKCLCGSAVDFSLFLNYPKPSIFMGMLLKNIFIAKEKLLPCKYFCIH